jgi:ABC-type transporter Mla subunit MlaD
MSTPVGPVTAFTAGPGSGSPTSAAAAMGSSLENLGQLIINLQNTFANLGKLIADMKANIAQLSQQAQDNFSRTCDQNNGSSAVNGNSIDHYIAVVQSGGSLSDTDAGTFSAMQQQLSAIVNEFQAPDNKISPILTSIQNVTQSLPSEFTQILSGDSAPMVSQTITQLLQKGL